MTGCEILRETASGEVLDVGDVDCCCLCCCCKRDDAVEIVFLERADSDRFAEKAAGANVRRDAWRRSM